MTNRALAFAAAAEAATGLAMIVAPSFVGQMLLGEQFVGAAIPVARVAGIALIALGVACWPGPALAGMLFYGTAVTVYLAFLGSFGEASGMLLWPAVVLHAILAVFLARSWFATEGKGNSNLRRF